MKRLLLVLLPAFAALFLSACESYEDDDSDHEPADGFGGLVIKNNTYNDIDVFVDGVRVARVHDGHERAFDYAGGEYRVFLDEDDGPRDWVHNVDVLQDRNTILDVRNDAFGFYNYEVTIYHRKP